MLQDLGVVPRLFQQALFRGLCENQFWLEPKGIDAQFFYAVLEKINFQMRNRKVVACPKPPSVEEILLFTWAVLRVTDGLEIPTASRHKIWAMTVAYASKIWFSYTGKIDEMTILDAACHALQRSRVLPVPRLGQQRNTTNNATNNHRRSKSRSRSSADPDPGSNSDSDSDSDSGSGHRPVP